MSKRARNIRKAQKNVERSKKKARKKARFAIAQEAQQSRRREKVGKWRGMNRVPNRNRSRDGVSCMSLEAFSRLVSLSVE